MNQSVEIIKRLKGALPVHNTYESISSRIPLRMNELQITQKRITSKNSLQHLPLLVQKCIGIYNPAVNESWASLFKRQLATVSSLAADVDYLVHVAEDRSEEFTNRLYGTIDAAIANRKERDMVQASIEPAHKALEGIGDISEDALDLRRKKIAAEFAVYGTVLESARLEDAAKFDVSRIDFLEKNALFYMGLLASAKQVSTKTKQLCSTLDTLVDVYATIDPLAQTLHSLGDGVDVLKVHTAQLSQTYENALSATLRQNPADTVLPSIREPVDGMLYTMLDVAEQKLT